jgi:Flp pilus assembly protein TadB
MNKKELLAIAEDLGSMFGSCVAFVIVNAIASVFFYLIISLMIGIPVTYLQVFGVLLLISWFFKFIQNILA